MGKRIIMPMAKIMVKSESSRTICASRKEKEIMTWSNFHEKVYTGNYSDVERMIKENSRYVNKIADLGQTPLYLAIVKGHLEITRLLLANGADPNFKVNDKTPIEIAVKSLIKPEIKKKIVELLIEKNANIDDIDERIREKVEEILRETFEDAADNQGNEADNRGTDDGSISINCNEESTNKEVTLRDVMDKIDVLLDDVVISNETIIKDYYKPFLCKILEGDEEYSGEILEGEKKHREGYIICEQDGCLNAYAIACIAIYTLICGKDSPVNVLESGGTNFLRLRENENEYEKLQYEGMEDVEGQPMYRFFVEERQEYVSIITKTNVDMLIPYWGDRQRVPGQRSCTEEKKWEEKKNF